MRPLPRALVVCRYVDTEAFVRAPPRLQVVEFWNTTPGDGYIYFVVRPPWVRPDRINSFFTIHPEERDWHTSHAVQEIMVGRRP